MELNINIKGSVSDSYINDVIVKRVSDTVNTRDIVFTVRGLVSEKLATCTRIAQPSVVRDLFESVAKGTQSFELVQRRGYKSIILTY